MQKQLEEERIKAIMEEKMRQAELQMMEDQHKVSHTQMTKEVEKQKSELQQIKKDLEKEKQEIVTNKFNA